MVHDLIIIGTGPAGLSAGLLAGRYGLDTVLLEREDLGGELVNEHTIETYPGFPDAVAGPELRESIVEQLREYELDLKLAEATEVTTDDEITVATPTATYESRTLIVATGERHDALACPGGDEYDHRGIFYCALCDGPLYRDERVAVVGCGERALMDAVYLAEFTSEVLVVGSTAETPASETVRKRVEATPNVKRYPETEVVEVAGDDVVGSIQLRDLETGNVRTEPVGGVLARSGSTPNTEALPSMVERSDSDHVTVDTRMETTVSGVFAAGGVRENAVNQVVSAAGDGMRACYSAMEYLE